MMELKLVKRDGKGEVSINVIDDAKDLQRIFSNIIGLTARKLNQNMITSAYLNALGEWFTEAK